VYRLTETSVTLFLKREGIDEHAGERAPAAHYLFFESQVTAPLYLGRYHRSRAQLPSLPYELLSLSSRVALLRTRESFLSFFLVCLSSPLSLELPLQAHSPQYTHSLESKRDPLFRPGVPGVSLSSSPPLPLSFSLSRLPSPGALTALHEHAALSVLPAGKKALLGQEKHAALPAVFLYVPVHQCTASRLVSTCCPSSGRILGGCEEGF
jgi:hypothetical protein